MTKNRLVLIIVGLVCFVAGATSAFYLAKNMQAHVEVSAAAVGIATSTLALESLRSGDKEKVAALLESTLDGHVLALTLFPGCESRNDVKNVLSKALAYRNVHPRSSGSPGVDAAVTKVLTSNVEE